jgi:hypothetical protein
MGTSAKGTKRIVFEAQSGPQTSLISCPIEDVFYGGARGGGKTYGLLGDWLSHSDLHGENARGIFFRRTYDELDEVQDRASRIFPAVGGVYNSGKRTWFFANGSTLKLRYLDRDADADRYQGHAYTWMAFDELTNWPDPKPIDKLRACLRSGDAPIDKSFRASGNPGGVGHNWVKARYIDPAPPLSPFYDKEAETWRVFIPSTLDDNPALLKNDPDYWKRVKAATAGDEALEKAWRWGDWNIVAGGMLDDLWRRSIHVIDPFDIPKSWKVDRTFDWGSSKPFGVAWWAESDGTQAPNGRHYPRGSVFLIDEWYGWNGRPNEGCKMLAIEIARGIKDREIEMPFKVQPGCADSSIFDAENGVSIADDMAKVGIKWLEADKSPGSRKIGWERIRRYLKAATGTPMEESGLFIFDPCLQWIRTVPSLPRDKKKRDDVDTDAEDHLGDLTRYRLMAPRPPKVHSGRSAGIG